jgi:hypothetical protein
MMAMWGCSITTSWAAERRASPFSFGVVAPIASLTMLEQTRYNRGNLPATSSCLND